MTDLFAAYAEIALMAPIYTPYTYGVPPEMAGRLATGSRVVVPIGRSHANGVVLGVTSEPPAGVTCKGIISLVDEKPLVDAPRIHLAQWLARYYFAPPGECLRLFFPPGSYVGTTFAYRITAAGRTHLNRSRPPLRFTEKVLKLIAGHTAITRQEIGRTITSRNLDRVLSNLEKDGHIQRESVVLGARTGFRRVYFIELRDDTVDPTAYPSRQQALLHYMLTHQGPLPLSRAIHGSDTAHDVARALEKKGLIRIFTEESHRDPFLDYDPSEMENHVLTPPQVEAIRRISTGVEARQAGHFLLFGVTGSGKTQVYIEIIKKVLTQGRTALVLVPEIALTPILTRRFMAHFQDELAILHSMLSDGERHDQWFRIHRREARVVIGTRSALFAPLAELGLVIIDEEHDGSYKQSETPRYHAREVAKELTRMYDAVLVLGSATPALESYHAATETSDMELLELPERILNRPLPEVKVIDLAQEFERHGKSIILAGEVHRAIAERMRSREQVMVLLNRRGFSSLLLCRRCGATVICDHCSISMTYHHREKKLLCHYCGGMKNCPDECAECGSRYIHFLGTGTEKLEQLFRARFPGRRVERFDRDTTRKRGSMKEILERFEQRQIDLLVGTQMIAKGHDFPGVTLVVVLSTDTSLRIPDFRSAERTFQLLTQVAGRSGRGDTPGEVYLQTYYPNHYAVRLARAQDYPRFYQAEVFFRRQFFYPPFARLVYLGFRDKDNDKAARLASRSAVLLRSIIRRHDWSRQFRILGPAPALLEKIRDEYRYSLLIRCLDSENLFEFLSEFRQECAANNIPFQRIILDVDPLDLT
ncbi:MAG: primosomal protein N' [Acidobacteria bacterium]|nr:primosomal protein N' [Acidobacteriota bacterium]